MSADEKEVLKICSENMFVFGRYLLCGMQKKKQEKEKWHWQEADVYLQKKEQKRNYPALWQ